VKFLHSMLRVSDPDATVAFFQLLGLEERRRMEVPEGKFTLIFLGVPGDDAEVELTHNWEESGYEGGRNFGHLAYLVDDLRDPDLRHHLETQARRTRSAITKLLAEAVARGELAKRANPKRLARTVETIIGGSMLTWATYREGTAVRWMRQDLELVLAPFLKRKA